jgi:hypothetical protein
MTPAERNEETDRWHAELAARFDKRRCRCGAPAIVIVPGEVAVREAGITLTRAKPDRNLCSFHAGLLSNERAA